MNLKIVALAGLGGVLLAAALGVQLMREGYDEPEHDVLLSEGDFEVRRYAPRIVAETVVSTDDWRSGTSTGFERLAGFIFGDNRDADGESMKIAMTTPVESVPEPGSRYTVIFTMPDDYALEDLPTPGDDRVHLSRVPSSTVATLRFSGRAARQDIDALSARLREEVRRHGYETTSPVKIAQYDPPWVAGPLRRNELMVDVRPRGE